MMFDLLAAAGPDSGFTVDKVLPWITTFVVGVIGVVLRHHGKAQGFREGQKTKTTIEDQPIGVSTSDDDPSTKGELKELKEELEDRLGKIEEALNKERDIARTANGRIHERIDRVSENLAEMRGEIRQMNNNLERLLERGMKGGTGR
jgi:hypothetical protein